MDRFLVAPIYLFAGLSVLHWADVNRLMRGPAGCGNAYSDPFRILVNVIGPWAAFGLIGLYASRRKARRRPSVPWLAFPLFFGTTTALAYEAYWFGQYGLEIGRVWWLPRLW